MAGRKPKPTHLKIVQGTIRKDRANKAEPKPVGDLSLAPTFFSEQQREVWDYAIAHSPKGLLKQLDLSVLEVWVTACVFHREASAKVTLEGQVVTSPKGHMMTNPHMSNMNRQAQIMLKAAAEMGFTPASRSRIAVPEQGEKSDPWASFAAEA